MAIVLLMSLYMLSEMNLFSLYESSHRMIIYDHSNFYVYAASTLTLCRAHNIEDVEKSDLKSYTGYVLCNKICHKTSHFLFVCKPIHIYVNYIYAYKINAFI